MYFPVFWCFFVCGIAVVSSIIVFFIFSVSYALSASMYFGLYSFIILIADIANTVSNHGPFLTLWCLISMYSKSIVI